jgi:mannose-6-phosphate isomerase-like protein (cupin superfamily)
MSRIRPYSVLRIAAELEKPFSMVDVAYIDDLLLSVYICQGALHWHRHIDIDELFWVCEGSMLLQSERGDATMRSGELAVVPKGTQHRSRSDERAVVLLLRCGLVPHRKNGKRQLYVTDECGLPAVNLKRKAEKLAAPYRFRTVAEIEDSRVQLARGNGRWPIELPVAHDRLVYVVAGRLTVRTVRDRLRLGPGEFTVIPRGAFYHLYSEEDTRLVRVTREAL